MRIEVFPLNPNDTQYLVKFNPQHWDDIRLAEHTVIVTIGTYNERENPR